MTNTIKYSTSGGTLAINEGSYWIGVGDVPKGPTPVTDYWSGISPPLSGYTIYLGRVTNGPIIYTTSTDAELISLTNTIGGQSFSTIGTALNWYNTQADKMVVNIDYPTIVTSGMVLNLDAGFVPSYPTINTTWYDVSGSGNTGTLINGPTFSTSGGGSIVFDGIDDIATIGAGTNYPYPYSTYEMWVKTAGIASGMTIAGLIGLDYGRLMFIAGNGAVQYIQQSGPSTVLVNTSVVPTNAKLYDNSYHQILCLRNTTSAQIYVDGVLQQTVGNGGNPSWDGLNTWSTMLSRLATNPNNQAFYMLKGSIPITRIYNRGLSSSEVLQNYQSTFTRFLGENIVTSGLVFYVDAGYSPSYPTSGLTWYDVSGYGNNGTLTNGPTYSSANGGSIVFDGVDDYVSLPINSTFNTPSVTYEVWANLQTISDRHILYVNWQGNALEVNSNRSVTMFNFSSGGQLGATTAANVFNWDSWTHFLGTYDASSQTLKTYVNGVLLATRTSTPSTIYAVGTHQISGVQYGGEVKGNISIVRQYNRELTQTEITQNYNAQKSRYGL
jgi:hypothetical protein